MSTRGIVFLINNVLLRILSIRRIRKFGIFLQVNQTVYRREPVEWLISGSAGCHAIVSS